MLLNFPTCTAGVNFDFSSHLTSKIGILTLKQHLKSGIIKSPQQIPTRKKGADFMIYQNVKNEQTPNEFSSAIRELQNPQLLRKSSIVKSCGISAFEVFQEKNLYRFLNPKHKDQAVSKNTYYRFLNETSFNWNKFLLLLATKVTSAFDVLTRPERVKVLVLDDSVITRNRSNSVELLARV